MFRSPFHVDLKQCPQQVLSCYSDRSKITMAVRAGDGGSYTACHWDSTKHGFAFISQSVVIFNKFDNQTNPDVYIYYIFSISYYLVW